MRIDVTCSLVHDPDRAKREIWQATMPKPGERQTGFAFLQVSFEFPQAGETPARRRTSRCRTGVRRPRMCGIVGFMDRTGAADARVGRHLLEMLAALGRRGPDSAGVAIFGRVPAKAGDDDRLVLRMAVGERGDGASATDRLLHQAGAAARVRAHSLTGSYFRLEVDGSADVRMLMEVLERQTPHPSVEVISMGRRLEIVKQVGTLENMLDVATVHNDP